MIAEYEQLENLSVFTPVGANSLPPEVSKGVLYAICLIKEKRTGILNGRIVVDGRKQRPLYDKYEMSSLALSQDSFNVSLIIDVYENRYVGIADVAGAFLKAK